MKMCIYFPLLKGLHISCPVTVWTASGILGSTCRKSQVWLQHYWMAMDKMFPGPEHNLGGLPKRRVKVQTAIIQSWHPHHDWESHLRSKSYSSGRTILYSQSPGGKKRKSSTRSLPLTKSVFSVFSEKAGFGTVQHATAPLSFTFQLLCVINFKYGQLL